MPPKHIRYEDTARGRENRFVPFSSRSQQQGIKRKRDFGSNGPQIRTVNGTNGMVSSSKPNGLHNVSRFSHPQSSFNRQAPNTMTRKEPAPSLAEVRQKLLLSLTELPIYPHTSAIRRALTAPHHLLVLSGSTGSGKSTQVPQMLLDESWCAGGCIAVTQPRRVAAISLAVRVAQEMGTTLGRESRNSKVGYSVRFDENIPPVTFSTKPGVAVGKGARGAAAGPVARVKSSAMRIKYLTEGMLVQEIARDPWLRSYKAVIVDEVHERSVNVDLILGFLRRILVAQEKDEVSAAKTKGKEVTSSQKEAELAKNPRAKIGKLKVVVMSATADTEAIFNFFEDGFLYSPTSKSVVTTKVLTNGISHQSKQNGSTSHESASGYESEESWEGLSSTEDEKSYQTNGKSLTNGTTLPSDHEQNGNELNSEHISTCHIEGRQYPVQVMYLPEPAQDFVEAALKTIFQIHYKEPLPGDILVFLTGQDTVEALETLVNEHAAAMGPEVPKLLILPLFAALPQSAQQLVFNPTPPHTRKLILATNIAETSLTIPGIRHVIDSGLAKIKEYRSALALDSLLVQPISQSSAIQRKGRAGREAPGSCWRLYTEPEYLKLPAATVPEILRCDLAAALLTMKARGVEDVMSFPLLDRPHPDAMRKALLTLHRLGALNDNGEITPAGKQMARLPLPPQLSRVIIAAADPVRNCLLDILDIVACLSVESIFLPLTSDEKKEEAEAARRELFRREGDHLTLMATLQAYTAEQGDRRSWCDRHFMSHRALRNAMDVRKQLRQQCVTLGLMGISANDHNDSSINVNDTADNAHPQPLAGMTASSIAHGETILRTLLTGFAQNTARLCPDGSYKTLEGNQTVAIHPGSVLFGKKLEAIMYNELVWTTKCWARGVSAVKLDWWADVVGVGG